MSEKLERGTRPGPAIGWLALALVVVGPPAAADQGADEPFGGDPVAALAAAEELILSGFYGEAAERLSALGADLPPAGEALLGRALALDRRYLAAEPVLRRAVAAGWADLPTLFYLGSTLWENGKLDEAGEAFTRALALSEGHPAILQQLGRLALWRGHWREAAEHFDRALAAAPGDLESMLDRARALEGAGRTQEAIDDYRAVVAAAPEYAAARYGLGRLLVASGANEAGRRELEIYRRLLAAELESTRVSGRERAGLNRGLALLHRGEAGAAIEHLAGLSSTPDNLDALARALDAAGRHDESVAALERAVALAPQRRDLRDRLTEARLARPPTDR